MMKNNRHFSISFLLVLAIFLGSCETEEVDSTINMTEGEKLSERYCVGCHAYPSPDMLSKESWERVLPAMADFMGIYRNENRRDSLLQEPEEVRKRLIDANVYSAVPMATIEDYELIYDFYMENAYDTDSLFSTEKVELDLKQFKVFEPDQRVKIPSTTMAYIKGQQLYIGDANTKSLSIFDKDLNLVKTGNVSEGAVWLNFFDNVMFVTVMGSFSPTDRGLGMLLGMPTDPGKQARVILEELQRPVHTATGDLDGDGREDIVVCEFGYRTGGLTAWLNKGGNKFQEVVLYNKPGATRSLIRDYDGDNDLDIIALIGQADESITLFRNDGQGSFSAEKLIQFPPMYGSTYFDMVDYDGDGTEEILYCNGDNADLSQELKRYHGIRIFDQDDDGLWTEVSFLQLNGAYKALIEDFDLDGDADIAAISFFPDFYDNPGEAFVYMENTGSGYRRHSFANPDRGRWIVMDKGDPDGDGDIDLVLGSLTMEVDKSGSFVEKWMNGGLPFVFLENQGKKVSE